MEKWKEIPDIGLKISDYGNVRTIKLNRWMRPTMVGKGYTRVNYKRTPYYIHRLVLEAFEGPCPPGYEINHKNGVKTDNRLSNLEYVTSSENTQHSIMNGSFPTGENRYNAKYTNEQVKTIRQLYRDGFSYGRLAELFNGTYIDMVKIIKHYTYKHVA